MVLLCRASHAFTFFIGSICVQGIAGRQRLGSSFKEDATLDFEETNVIWGRLLEGMGSMSMPPPTRPPEPEEARGTLLAIGDSLCTGQLPEPKNTVFFSDEGFVDVLFEYLEDNYDFDKLQKICCPGEDSAELIDASFAVPPSDGSNCYLEPNTPPSQLDAAITALQSGEIGLISISIGANDVFSCAFAPNPEECATTQIESFVMNLQFILNTLEGATDDLPPIVAITPYNPLLALFLSEDENERALVPISQQAVVGLQTEAAKVYDAFNVETVFGHFIFGGLNDTLVDGTPQNVINICKYTGMCDETESGYVLKSNELRDIHPVPKGYEKLGIAHFDPVDELL